MTPDQIKTVSDMLAFLKSRAGQMEYILGHVPPSGIYTGCSYACQSNCLIIRIEKLLKEIKGG